MYKIIFSATGRTEKVADGFCNAFDKVDKIDLSNVNFEGAQLNETDFCLIAAPVYGGRIPTAAAERLLKIKANGAKAVVMVVFGNRAYDNALAELKYMAEKAGFVVYGAVAAVAQHSMITDVAADRPDENDIKQLMEFAVKISKKADNGQWAEFSVNGDIPQGKVPSMPVHPKATQNCTGCGVCAEKCPTKAISSEKPQLTDKTKCITCMRCVEVCPHNERVLMPALMKVAGAVMKKVWGKHTEIEFYM